MVSPQYARVDEFGDKIRYESLVTLATMIWVFPSVSGANFYKKLFLYESLVMRIAVVRFHFKEHLHML